MGNPDNPQEEHRITRAIARKDFKKALELLARAHAARLGRLCYAMVGNQAEAEELAQEILIAAFRAMPEFEGRSSVRTWLYTIARRTCGRALQKQRRRNLILAGFETLPPKNAVDPHQRLESSDEARQLRHAMDELPPSQREVLLLRYVGGLRFKEVARVCGVSEEAARQRASTGLRRLRGILSEGRSVATRPSTEQQASYACQESR